MFRKSLFYMNFMAKLKAAVFQTFEYVCGLGHKKKPAFRAGFGTGGERGIRTPGRLITFDCFQDSSIQPLWHFSVGKNRNSANIAK